MLRTFLAALSLPLFASFEIESGSYGPQGGSAPIMRVEQALLGLIHNMKAREEVPGDTYGALIRLVFHDAGTYDKWRGTGGAHACIAVTCDKDDGCEYRGKQHKGLQYAIDNLNDLYEKGGFYTVCSRADFLHFAGFLAVKLSAPAYAEYLYFQFGRTDCPHKVPKFDNMPVADQLTFDYYWSFFDNMGLSQTDMIALLGAHTVGRMERKNQGYEGPWVYATDVFDNEYYKAMYDPGMHWYRTSLQGPEEREHFYTSGDDSRVPMRSMLRADLALFWDLKGGRCEINGRAQECPKNKWFYSHLEKYAHDNHAWMWDFCQAFMKLQALGMGHAYGDGLGYNPNYDGYGGIGQGDSDSWGKYGGEYSTWKDAPSSSYSRGVDTFRSRYPGFGSGFSSGFGSGFGSSLFNRYAAYGARASRYAGLGGYGGVGSYGSGAYGSYGAGMGDYSNAAVYDGDYDKGGKGYADSYGSYGSSGDYGSDYSSGGGYGSSKKSSGWGGGGAAKKKSWGGGGGSGSKSNWGGGDYSSDYSSGAGYGGSKKSSGWGGTTKSQSAWGPQTGGKPDAYAKDEYVKDDVDTWGSNT